MKKLFVCVFIIMGACAPTVSQLHSEYKLVGNQASIRRELKDICWRDGLTKTVTWSADKTEAIVYCR
jgi:hypothetical protein